MVIEEQASAGIESWNCIPILFLQLKIKDINILLLPFHMG